MGSKIQAKTPPPLCFPITISQTNIACNGGNDGEGIVSPIGGISPYTYNWSNGSTDSIASNLVAGTYTVTVTDSTGCTSDTTVTITEPPLLSGTTSETMVSCNGGNDGESVITPTGGTLPYSYNWSNGSTSATVNGLTAGTYTVTVTDGKSCTFDTSVTITEPPLLSGTTSETMVSCNGGNDGESVITVTGGTTPYTYNWSNGSTAATASGLAAGTYTVTVTDGKSCTFNTSVTITELPVLVASIVSSTDVFCEGGNNGSVIATVTGGTPGYTYLWDDPLAQTTLTISNLIAGTYQMTTTDAKGCMASVSVIINQPPPVITSTGSIDVSCAGGNDGKVWVTPNGALPLYIYAWNPNFGINDTLNNLIAGNYTVTVTDGNGCVGVETIVVSEPPVFAGTITSTNSSCNGASDGTATVSVNGGTSPYTYLWNDPFLQTDSIATGLPPGTYTAKVTDANGCEFLDVVTITESSPLFIPSPTITNEDCQQSNGKIQISIFGGNAPYSILWDDPLAQDSVVATDLSAGVYTVMVSDAGGCSTTRSATITNNFIPPTAFISASQDVSCAGGNDGEVTVTPSGGTPPYNILWNPGGQTTNTITGLSSGTYVVTVTDLNSCPAYDTVVILEPLPLTATMTQVNSTCGLTDGEAIVTVSGGQTPYTYNWSSGGSSATETGLPTGAHIITITDVKGCIIKDTANIIVLNPITLSTTLTDITCNGDANGTGTTVASGGSGNYFYNWTSGGSAATETNLGVGSYVVTVADDNNCEAKDTITITEPPLLVLTLTSTNVSCNGASDGTAAISVTGGITPYTYNWTSGGSADTETGLGAGTYTVTVTDAKGCIETESVTITESTAIVLTPSSTDISCSGANNGSASVSVSGGDTPYLYSWTSGGSTPTESNLDPGTYTVTVTDAKGCVETESFTITDPDPLTTSTVTTDASCSANDGSAVTTPVGGTIPYTYNWTSGGSSPAESNLGIGTYIITITDSKGCSVNDTVTIIENNTLVLSSSSVDASCNGAADGSATVVASGGTSPYTYSWTSGGTGATENGLNPGTYTVTVTDAIGCQAQEMVTVSEPLSIVLTPSSTNVSCNGVGDGSVSVSVTGGATPYTYSWTSGGTSDTETGLGPGTYTVTVTDAGSCSALISINITEPTPLILTPSSTDVSCNGGSDGSVAVSVSGGTPAYTYSWTSGGTSASELALNAGSYTVTVTDASSCSETETITINEPVALTLTPSSTDATCGNTDGSATITPTGGTTPYTYSWSSGGTGASETNLGAGIYTVTVIDDKGCTETGSITIINQGSITVTSSYTDVSCNGAGDGTGTVTPLGGSGSYTYSWSSGGTGATETGLGPGTYTVDVADAANPSCIITETITISEPLTIVLTPSSTDISCNGAGDGTVSVTPTGGTTPYTYSWSSGGTSDTETGLGPGSYTVTVTDSVGCIETETITITEPSVLSVTPSQVNVSCGGAADGAASIVVAGGTTPYTYSWSSGGTSDAETGLGPGSYTVIITDARGCSETETITITEPTPLLLTPSSTNATCGNSDGSASVVVSGGTPVYTYNWSNGGTTDTEIGLAPGTYTITVTDGNSCSATESFTIIEQSQITATTSTTDVTCNGGSNGTGTATPSGGSGSYTYSWSSGGTGATESGLAAGTYTVTIADAVNPACVVIETITIIEPPILVVTITPSDVVCAGGSDGQVTTTVTGGTTPYTYSWDNGGAGPTEAGLGAGTYTVTVTDGNGCQEIIPAIINEPPPLTLSMDSMDISCFDADDGWVSASPGGGVPGYTYNWTPGGNDSLNGGLEPGTYTVVVTDANGCTITDERTIIGPPGFLIDVDKIDATCGNNDGLAWVSVTGGYGPFSFLWTPGGSANDTIFDLFPGTYQVTVTDDSTGCDTVTTVTIIEPQLVATMGSVNVQCKNNNDGLAWVSVTGGSGVYNYLWTPGGGTNDSISGLAPGTYIVSIDDTANCIITDSVTITEPDLLVVTKDSTNVDCFGDNTGTASVVVTGGTLPYTYSWLPGGQTGNSITGLTAGTYQYTVTDGNGCTIIDSITIEEPPAIIVNNIGATDITINGANDGTAFVNVSGGISPYTYSWAPGGMTTDSINNLAPGTYIVTITDSNGCSIVDSVVVNEPPLLVLNMNQQNTPCGLSEGIASVTVSGGIPPYTVLWSGGETTDTITNLSPGTYIVIVTDSNGSVKSDSVTIIEQGLITLTMDSTNVTCNGFNDGKANVVAVGGSGVYTYLWSPGGETTDSINNLIPGTYAVTVTDDNGCLAIDSVQITEPAPLSLVMNAVDVLCNGDSSGKAIALPSGGTTPYSYNWQSISSTSDTINSLYAGVYKVVVTDANNCSLGDSVQIVEPTPIVVTFNTQNLSCKNSGDGSTSINVSGGVVPYAYLWSPTGETTDSITNLNAGTYFVNITDSNGCVLQDSVTIGEPDSLNLALSKQDLTCGSNDGKVNTLVTGGNGNYTYSWLPGGETTDSIINLSAGVYTVVVKDSLLCTITDSIELTVANSIVLAGQSENPNCYQSNDGTAKIIVNGGSGLYNYSWFPGGETTDSISGLVAGTYTVTVTDVNLAGCTNTDTIILTQPDSLNTTITGVNVSCNGLSDASATVSVAGGTGPYIYNWQPLGNTNATAIGLAVGIHLVAVTDSNGCSIQDSIVITEPIALSSILSGDSITCFGGLDGSANVSVAGGVSPYTYLWSNGETTDTIINLLPGEYTVNIRDSNNCLLVDSITIYQPDSVSLITTATTAGCGFNTGTVDVDVTGGTAPYTYLWSPGGVTTDSVFDLFAGTYVVTVTDFNGCIYTDSATIVEPDALIITMNSKNVTCFSNNNGIASVTATGGTGAYLYSWIPTALTTDSINGLAPGTYTVTVTDSNNLNCIITDSIVITEPQLITTTITGKNLSCFNDNSGEATVSVVGGTAPYSYLWFATGDINDTATMLSAGTYVVEITDSNNCLAQDTIVITEPTQLTSSLVTVDASCGLSIGKAFVTPSGGTQPYTYLWSPNGETTDSIVNLPKGNYPISITDSNGCSVVDTAKIIETNGINLSFTTTNISCYGENDGLATVVPTGGSGSYSYLWDSGNTNPNIINLSPGTYIITVTDNTILNCEAIDSVVIVEPDSISLNVDILKSSCTGNNNYSAVARVSGGTPPYTYQWSNGATTDSVPNLSPGSYIVVVRDLNGCETFLNFDITAPPALFLLPIQSIHPTCNVNNGELLASIFGGTAPYTVSWNDPLAQDSIRAVNLAPGLYTVTVTDASGCVATRSATINNTITPPSVIVSMVKDITCYGLNDGEAGITVSGGAPPYVFDWSPLGGNTLTTDSLTPGRHYVTVTDTNNCVVLDSVNITEPSPLLVTDSVINVSCFGLADGKVFTTTNGGTTPYNYLWSPNGETSDSLSLLDIGRYILSVTDGNGCSVGDTIDIIQPDSIVLQLSAKNASCFSYTDGELYATSSGGVSPYSYVWAPIGTVTDTVFNVGAGSYILTVTDSTGCVAVDSIIVNEPPALTIAFSSLNVSCFGGNDGEASLIAGGGVGFYNYLWSPNGETTDVIQNLVAGTYEITLTDSNNCSLMDSITILEPNPITSSFSTIDVNCKGGLDGMIDLTVSGGTQPYSYLWSTNSILEDISGLGIGTYSVTITDSNLCVKMDTVDIAEPNVLVIDSIYIKDLSCYNIAQGAIDIRVIGGVPPYSYNWSNGDTTQNIMNISAGTYYVLVTDANGCVIQDSMEVFQPTLLSFTMVETDAVCNGYSDGSVDVTVIGGELPYTYSWDNGSQTEDLIGLSKGNYVLTVTDSNGCTATDTAVVSEPPLLPLTISGITPTCKDSCNGSVSIIANSIAPYTYFWSNGSATNQISNLCDGFYSVSVTDANGCTNTDSVTLITLNDLPIILTNEDTSVCKGEEVKLTGTGGVVYEWYEGNPASFVAATVDYFVQPLSETIYTIKGTDVYGCVGFDTVIIKVDEPVHADFLHTVVCAGEVTKFFNKSTPGVNYLWDFGDGNISTNDSVTHIYQTGGTYNVKLTVSRGGSCVDTIVRQVDVFMLPNVDFVADTLEGCPPLNVNFTNLFDSASYEYFWSFGDGQRSSLSSPSHQYEETGVYTVFLRAKTLQGCMTTFTKNAYITVHPVPVALFTIDKPIADVFDSRINFIDGSIGADFWNWNFGYGGVSSELQYPSYTYPEPGEYIINLLVTNQFGCVDSTFRPIKINDFSLITAPSAFTPDGDDLNESFMPALFNIDPDQFHFMIFDRWGELIYETYDVNKPWNGRKYNKMSLVQIDTYVWVIEATDIFGKSSKHTGRVSIVR
ncbi:MAG: PKD domain-containing protein [Vicingus serpentipes]|nr:PKD domain-containing protein [Vicingus serpentipes]